MRKHVITDFGVFVLVPADTGKVVETELVPAPLYFFTTFLTTEEIKFLEKNVGSKDFEKLVRAHPGKYANGSWVQVNGFYGYYLDTEITLLVSTPPPITRKVKTETLFK
jgi:hypothetical protein